MKHILTLLVLFLLVARLPTAQAQGIDDIGNASRLVASLATRASIISYEPGLTASSRRARLLNILENRFAFTEIGQFAMGRHWRHVTISEQRELEHLFRTVLPEISFDRLARYLDHNLRIDGAILLANAGRNGDIALVRSVWNGGAQPVRIDWRIESRAGGLKVTDVLVNGLSMASTWREYMARSGQNHGPSGVIDRLHLDYERAAGGRMTSVAMTSAFRSSLP